MTKYKIGDKDLVLEEVICISETGYADANRIYVDVWLKGVVNKIKITIDAMGAERNADYTGGMNMQFLERAKTELGMFRDLWKQIK
jgi:hypothetical protein